MSASSPSCGKSGAVKRIMQELRELQSHSTDDYYAAPLDDNLFEWHFTIRGPRGTEFDNGIYHGRILLPSDYPFKPPDLMLLTPSGRFEVGKKICLSISGFHPEHWQPSWSIRTVLVALIAFMPSEPQGAIGSLNYSKSERQYLANESRTWKCPACGIINHEVIKSQSPPTTQTQDTGIDSTDSTVIENHEPKHTVYESPPESLYISQSESNNPSPKEDLGWTLITLALILGIVAILIKKIAY
jgi:ubiquitin-conjugating enzyme E2 J1